MTGSIELDFRRMPLAPLFMARALERKRRREMPSLSARWRGARVPARMLADFERLAGQRCVPTLPVAFVHAWTFRLPMVLLTHHAFPLPIWQSLQVRNRILQRRPVDAASTFEVSTRTTGQRRLAKGCEFDLLTALADEGGVAWECVSTFYYRGRMRGDDESSPYAVSPALDAEPGERWAGPRGGGWRFGAVTGDYNVLHWSDALARRAGFPGAFNHPVRPTAHALARLDLPSDAPAQRLDTWVKGPVRYGAELALAAERGAADATTFALYSADDPRPAIVGRWARAGAEDTLEPVG